MSDPWKSTKLSEVMNPIQRTESIDPLKQYRLLGIRLDGGGPFHRETKPGSQIAAKSLSKVRQGDFIYSRLFAWRGAFGVIGPDLDECYVSTEFPTFTGIAGRVDVDFLRLWFRLPATLSKVEAACTGSTPLTRNRFKEKFFLKMEIPLPSLDEQRRIVTRIEELAAKVAEARDLRQQAVDHAEAVYWKQLTAVMDPHREGWIRKTVAEVINSMDAGWSPQCEDTPASKAQWGVLKTTAVQWCEFRPYENKALPIALTPTPELAVRKGDVLVTRAGPRKRVGVVAAVHMDETKLTISDKIIRIRTNPLKIDYRFLELALASPFSQEHLVQRKTGLADAQVNISQPILKETPVAYPLLPEQRKIVAYLGGLRTKVDVLRRLQDETATELNALFPSILHNALMPNLPDS